MRMQTAYLIVELGKLLNQFKAIFLIRSLGIVLPAVITHFVFLYT